MNSKILVSLIMTLFVVFWTNVEAREIGGDIISTARIVLKLCLCKRSDEIATQFMACYDQAPGKDEFIKCQIESFGNPMDTKEHVEFACTHPTRLASYASCFKDEMQKNGVNATEAVDKVNKCQGKVLGLE